MGTQAHSVVHWTGSEWKLSNFFREVNSARAILVCGGPSLKNVDTSLLRGPGKVVLGMNNTYPFVVPDMWMGMDDPKCYDRRVVFEAFPKFFRGGYQDRGFQDVLPINMNNVHFINVKKGPREDIFRRAEKGAKHFIWHNHVMAVAMNLLIHMGFRDITLVGCDLDNTKSDYHNDIVLNEVEKSRNTRLYGDIYAWLKWLNKECRNRGIHFYSANPNASINDFMTYRSLDELNSVVEEDLPEPATCWNAYTLQKKLSGNKRSITK